MEQKKKQTYPLLSLLMLFILNVGIYLNVNSEMRLVLFICFLLMFLVATNRYDKQKEMIKNAS